MNTTGRLDFLDKIPKDTWVGLGHLLVVYIVWGSTYLAMRITVMDGSGFPPFSMGSSRLIVAGCLILLFCYFWGKKMRLELNEIALLVLTGNLMWLGGNGMVLWAERNVDSGYAALLVGTTPIWIMMVESIIDKKRPSWLLVISLFTGLLGAGILTGPVWLYGDSMALLDAGVLIFAAFSFGLGSLIQSRRPIKADPLVCSGFQQVFGGIGFTIVAVALREPWPTPSPEALWAWGYLVVFGSFIAFTSFLFALKYLPTNIATTYAYVNPVIAVFLGWLILDEKITIWIVAGTLLVLLGVAGIFRSRYAKSTSPEAVAK